MASSLIETQEGFLIEVEVEDEYASPIAGGAATKVQAAALESITPVLKAVCKPLINTWQELDKEMSMESAKVSLNLGFEGSGNVYFAKAKGSANLTVELHFKPQNSS